MRIPRSFVAAVATAVTLAPSRSVSVVILGVFVAISLGRVKAGRSAILLLPVVAIGAGVVGLLLHWSPPLGAAAFALATFTSIHLRRYGPRAAKIGRMLAAPLIGLLIAPGPLGDDPVSALLLAVLACAAAGFWHTALSWRLKPYSVLEPGNPVHTRFAAQAAVALILAFLAGMLLFPAHWPWMVISAFAVTVGARSRGHVLYRSVQRCAGALAGTATATVIAAWVAGSPPLATALAFGYLLAGLILRDRNYAYWAFCITGIMALLYGMAGQGGVELLGERLLAVVLGCVCGVLPAWALAPVRTHAALRKSVSRSLAALATLLERDDEDSRRHFEHHAKALRVAAEPLTAWQRLTHRDGLASCVEPLVRCGSLVPSAPTTADGPADRVALRRNIGVIRLTLARRPSPELLPVAAPQLAELDQALRQVHAAVAR